MLCRYACYAVMPRHFESSFFLALELSWIISDQRVVGFGLLNTKFI